LCHDLASGYSLCHDSSHDAPRIARKRRNFAILAPKPAGGVAKAIGEKLGTEAFEWLKTRAKDLGREGNKKAMGKRSTPREKRR